jgi:hypothetical protein
MMGSESFNAQRLYLAVELVGTGVRMDDSGAVAPRDRFERSARKCRIP